MKKSDKWIVVFISSLILMFVFVGYSLFFSSLYETRALGFFTVFPVIFSLYQVLFTIQDESEVYHFE